MKPVLNLALGATLGQIVVLVIVAGLCWAGDWTTPSHYSTALFGAGIVLALVGLVSGLSLALRMILAPSTPTPPAQRQPLRDSRGTRWRIGPAIEDGCLRSWSG